MTIRTRFSMPCLILALLGLLAFSATASAAPPIAKDGRIHACYKVKGKGKGNLRLARNAKGRCPRKWRKIAWSVGGSVPGPLPPAGAKGDTGAPGPRGEQGPPGTAGNVVVKQLEDKVTELLTKVQTLEGVLSGVTNTELLNAIGAVPAVGALCEQAEDLTSQTTALGTSLSSLNTVLNPLLIGFSPVTVPTALPAFSCPN